MLTVSNAAENEFVRVNLTEPEVLGVDGAWAGMTDEVVDGEWRWIDDTPGFWQDPRWFSSPIQTAYVSWAIGEPNAGEEENFLSIRDDGGWNDYSTERHGTPNDFYLVEWEPGSGPCTPIISSDLTGNCFVDFEDLTLLLSNWNKPDATA